MPHSAPYPGTHPEPPDDLPNRKLPVVTRIDPLFRLHGCNRDACFFGRTRDSRFDAPLGEYGALYLGDEPDTAFIETFGRSTGVNLVTTSAMRRRCLSRVEFSRALQLVDLTGPGLARLGADNRICTGDHSIAQRWALGLWSHPTNVDGVLYRARHDPSHSCVALFDRAASVVSAMPLGSLIEPRNQPLLSQILDRYAFGLLDDQ